MRHILAADADTLITATTGFSQAETVSCTSGIPREAEKITGYTTEAKMIADSLTFDSFSFRKHFQSPKFCKFDKRIYFFFIVRCNILY